MYVIRMVVETETEIIRARVTVRTGLESSFCCSWMIINGTTLASMNIAQITHKEYKEMATTGRTRLQNSVNRLLLIYLISSSRSSCQRVASKAIIRLRRSCLLSSDGRSVSETFSDSILVSGVFWGFGSSSGSGEKLVLRGGGSLGGEPEPDALLVRVCCRFLEAAFGFWESSESDIELGGLRFTMFHFPFSPEVFFYEFVWDVLPLNHLASVFIPCFVPRSIRSMSQLNKLPCRQASVNIPIISRNLVNCPSSFGMFGTVFLRPNIPAL